MKKQNSEIKEGYFADWWREVGFFYEFDNRPDVNQWRIHGSVKGLETFAKIIEEYSNDSHNDKLTEHIHLEPYMYLTITTYDKPQITNGAILGRLSDLQYLNILIREKLHNCKPGDTFSLDKEYGINNTAKLKLFVMPDNFDPASLDETIYNPKYGSS